MKKYLMLLLTLPVLSFSNIKDYLRTDVIEKQNFKITKQDDYTTIFRKENEKEILVINFTETKKFDDIKNNLIENKQKQFEKFNIINLVNGVMLNYGTNNFVMNDIISKSEKHDEITIVISYIDKEKKSEITNELAQKMFAYANKLLY